MLVLLEIVLIAAVLFAVAAFAVRGVGGMTEAPPERGDDGLPAGELHGSDLDGARFGLAFRGYRMAEVDAVLDRLREELVRCEQQLAARTEAAGDVPPAPDPAAEPAAADQPSAAAEVWSPRG